MKKWDRGPKYRKGIPIEGGGEIELREIERKDLVKDRFRVRGRYTKQDGRPGTFDAPNWRDALREANDIKKDLEEGRAARSKSPKFERVWKEWFAMREEEDLAPATLTNDKIVGRHLLEEFGKKTIESILPIVAERWLKNLAKSKPAITINCRSQLGRVFKFAKRKQYIEVNRFLEDPVNLKPAEHKPAWVPGWDPMDRIIVFGQGRRPSHVRGYPRLSWSNIKTAIALGGGAGLRISEVVALSWPNVDFANGIIKVRNASTSKGADDLPKKRKIRDVPMTQWVYDALFEHMHVLQRLGIKIEGPVIANIINKGRPCSRGAWNRSLRGFLVHAHLLESAHQMDPHWHWHVLRRFYISARFALGHRELDIREAVAHSSLDTTFKHYARALPEPPAIWLYRFRPAEPDDQPKVIDGVGGAVIVDGVAQLPAPDGADAELPQWVREAKNYLEGGWKLKEVMSHFQCSRAKLSWTFRKYGLRPPIEIYRAALYRRFEELYNDSVPPCDIATRTGVDVTIYERWRQTHEACAAPTHKSLLEPKEIAPQGRLCCNRSPTEAAASVLERRYIKRLAGHAAAPSSQA